MKRTNWMNGLLYAEDIIKVQGIDACANEFDKHYATEFANDFDAGMLSCIHHYRGLESQGLLN